MMGSPSSAPLRVVVTGSESTGKTTLAARLAADFGLPWVPEASRLHAENVGRDLGAADVELIARAHCAADDRAMGSGARAVVFDADLLSTVVYARHYYGSCPPWIEEEALRRRGDLYLLHHPDVPWIGDGVRDQPSPEQRRTIHARFATQLEAAGAPVVDVRGDWGRRYATARAAVERLLG